MGARLPQRSHGSDMETVRSLKDAQDWEKLEAWLLTIWGSWYTGDGVPMEDVERATLKLFLQRPTSIPRFEDLHANTPVTYPSLFRLYGDKFRRICDKTRAEQLCSESSPVSHSLSNPSLWVTESGFPSHALLSLRKIYLPNEVLLRSRCWGSPGGASKLWF